MTDSPAGVNFEAHHGLHLPTVISRQTAESLARALRDAGVSRLFGMPGGGSIAELIDAAAVIGLPFTMAHTETAAAFMAASYGEVSGEPGGCLATLGPGAASLVNGVAHGWLDRVPLIAITDGVADPMLHQAIPQGAIFGSITKGSVGLEAERVTEQVGELVDTAIRGLPGPVHLELEGGSTPPRSSPPTATAPAVSGTLSLEAIRLIRRSRRPVLLVGLGARTTEVAESVRAVADRGIPVLVTYKAKGVVPDDHRWYGGVLTHGALERPCLEQADLFIAIGLDPVELLPRSWSYRQPMVHLNAWPTPLGQLPSNATAVGDLAELVSGLGGALPARLEWSGEDIGRLRDAAREAMRPEGVSSGIAPHRVVEIVATARPRDRVTVDAGAHMFPALALWPVKAPRELLISNGLSSMGFALPAAIGAALYDRRATTVLTGDGGLLMCLAELRTAAHEGLPLRVIVFDDQALSLIKIKQVERGFRTDGVSLAGVDWVALGSSLGVPARRAGSEAELEAVLRETAVIAGPVLIDAMVDPSGYGATMKALRG